MVVWLVQKGKQYDSDSAMVFKAPISNLRTFRRVELLQDRLRTIEMAWRQFLPNVELSTALQTTENQQPHSNARIQSIKTTQSDAPHTVEPGQTSVQSGDLWAEAPKSISPPDSEYEDAETLDWDESVDTVTRTDGIGSLSTEWKGIGYMGPQTGNTLLRKLQSISVLYLSPEDEISIDHSLHTRLPEDVLNSSRFSDQCINWYFTHFHCAYPILHEGYFRAQLMGKIHLSILEPLKIKLTDACLM
jgi:transcriptional regulatory protein GAL4